MKRREDRQRESGSKASHYHVVTSNYVTLDIDLYLLTCTALRLGFLICTMKFAVLPSHHGGWLLDSKEVTNERRWSTGRHPRLLITNALLPSDKRFLVYPDVIPLGWPVHKGRSGGCDQGLGGRKEGEVESLGVEGGHSLDF